MKTAFAVFLFLTLLVAVLSGGDTNDVPPMKKWPPDMNFPNCSRLLKSNRYVRRVAKHRLSVSDEIYNFGTRCSDFHARGYYPESALSPEEAEFPIAFANIVYQDFILLERIFNVMYTPQNFYCFSIDNKASSSFKANMRNLARCFPNVIVPAMQYYVTSAGINVSAAHLSCMKALQSVEWKYIILLQNHDFPLRTNAELVKILKIFNGTNDISTLKITPTSFNPDTNWTYANLKLFRNNDMLNNLEFNGHLISLRPTKSMVSVSLSREMVDYILYYLDVSKLVTQMERRKYGMDENFISMLNSNEYVKSPGGFTQACLLRNYQVSSITRYATWNLHPEECGSGNFRHSVCIYGVEDYNRLIKLRHLFVNKMIPSFDYGAAMCLLETVYNRTYFGNDNPLFKDYYATLPHVRYNNLKKHLKPGQKIDLYTFNCSHPYQDYYF